MRNVAGGNVLTGKHIHTSPQKKGKNGTFPTQKTRSRTKAREAAREQWLSCSM